MFIEVEKWLFNGEASFKIVKAKKCCDDIIKSPNTCLNSDYASEGEDDYSVKLITTAYDDEIGVIEYFEKVNYCPFCGKEINIDIVREVDKSEKYETLDEERNVIREKYLKTDSKKEAQELSKKINSINEKINDLYENDNFDRVMEVLI